MCRFYPTHGLSAGSRDNDGDGLADEQFLLVSAAAVLRGPNCEVGKDHCVFTMVYDALVGVLEHFYFSIY